MQMSKVTNRVKSPEGIIGKAVLYAILMVVLVLLFRNIFLVTYVPSSSMEDTLEPGDLVFGTRYDAQEIERYDVMVFQAVDEDVCYVKRVIGLPGETIKVENGKVYADGIELDDSFVKENMDSSGDGTFKVPEGSYFMMFGKRLMYLLKIWLDMRRSCSFPCSIFLLYREYHCEHILLYRTIEILSWKRGVIAWLIKKYI